MELLPVIWFVLLGFIIAMYAALDGFDLGVGIVYPFLAKDEEEKRILLNSIGPVWDANEVWLILAGGALFAAFPVAYATLQSGLYLPVILILFMLILRAIGIDYRGKMPTPALKKTMDMVFFLGSLGVTFLFGLTLGNVIKGLPVKLVEKELYGEVVKTHMICADQDCSYTGLLINILDPYALLVALLTVSFVAMHGAIYAAYVTNGDLSHRAASLAKKLWFNSALLYLIVHILTMIYHPLLIKNYFTRMFIFPALPIVIVAFITIIVALNRQKYSLAFWSSTAMIFSAIGIAFASIYPTLVPSIYDENPFENPVHSITVFNSASSEKTLLTMLIIALIGVPMVLTYKFFVYRIFWGKVKVPKEGGY
ncbi:cytochrome d ubiquinol oxidase subunit II [Aquifex aeolicus]|uniref:Cytochrome oxidase d subunit II n=1 Tax=Aquifex aeolicus (strain VF5) TaxID=224324 RepID=O67371_AQUAE|nr:cytochrome d ubiquinol oxidase subunit II [Aquifex aeolicus]AAC07329.1 cytochrome oxidase d subunit II [Aquifex aeolicus VF5]